MKSNSKFGLMRYNFFCTIFLASSVLFPISATAESIALADYLSSMDRTEVEFSGRIRYNSSDDAFTFYDENREPFNVTLDAGRDTRERIQNQCCMISGAGTIEIRGSRIYISVEAVNKLSK